ncbi:peptide deformylase [Pantoea sp. Aalb]|uniref:peptide deformylase n=1 Tax=Pantoea sp. Aalb TaxID=2576762 RepID=UPI001324CE9F|nr:peptide deformylase [Pantoea sp. Aalb]MXP67909.1 peptide deformylase [Pantoea sp. Aalb]
MSVLKVLHFPNNRLRKIAQVVTNINPEIEKIIDNMSETMYAESGIGLAATQVDIHQRIIVIDISEDRNESIEFINPEILEKNGESSIEEGCLSVPNHYAYVSRAARIKVRAQNRYGNFFSITTDGLMAICIQHEIDHLNGKLFIDYLSPLKRQRIKHKLEKIARQNTRIL